MRNQDPDERSMLLSEITEEQQQYNSSSPSFTQESQIMYRSTSDSLPPPPPPPGRSVFMTCLFYLLALLPRPPPPPTTSSSFVLSRFFHRRRGPYVSADLPPDNLAHFERLLRLGLFAEVVREYHIFQRRPLPWRSFLYPVRTFGLSPTQLHDVAHTFLGYHRPPPNQAQEAFQDHHLLYPTLAGAVPVPRDPYTYFRSVLSGNLWSWLLWFTFSVTLFLIATIVQSFVNWGVLYLIDDGFFVFLRHRH